MTTVKSLLTEMRLGTSVAEFDEELQNYFVQTNVFYEFVNGRKDIIAGDKGTGKTAIFRYINKNFLHVPELEGKQIIPAFNFTGNPIFTQLAQKQTLLEVQYSALWKLYIFSLVGNQIVENNSQFIDSDLDKLLKALNVRTSIPEPKSVFSKIIGNLPNFFKWKSAEMEFTIGESGAPVIKPKIEFNGDEKGDEDLYFPPDDALEILDNAISQTNLEIWVTFDRLDEAFQGNSEVEICALRALLRTYLDLADLQNLKVKLFLRRDLFRRVTAGGFVNLTHINSKKIEIIWDEEDLLNLLARRIRESHTLTAELQIDQSSDQELFDKIFPDQVDFGLRKPKTWVWMMRRIIPNPFEADSLGFPRADFSDSPSRADGGL